MIIKEKMKKVKKLEGDLGEEEEECESGIYCTVMMGNRACFQRI